MGDGHRLRAGVDRRERRIASYEIPIAEGKPTVRFGDLPPGIHDEFSYLFQAKTFLAGRLWVPSSPRMPELFDQMHVLNERRFASRYFPGVGLWLAPFVAIGHPAWGEWLASALAAFFIFWAGRELAGNRIGLAAGLLTALSPGMALFSNLLLSHEPTMAGLALFLFAFLRLIRTGQASDAFVAGCGLSFAMLCRPLTAAAFALPFGLSFACRIFGATKLLATASRARILLTSATLGAPLLLGLAVLFLYDKAITGDGFRTPYQLYTVIYTPRHVYGFNNVARGEQRIGPKVMDAYDRWAKNLTPQLAVENVAARTFASAQWTLGPVPLAMAAVVFVLAALWHMDRRWRLVAASIITVHAAYVPYWLAGIMDWHYVFETGPLLLLVFAGTSGTLVAWWKERKQFLMPGWWAHLVVASVLINWIPFDPFWTSRADAGVEELARARVKHARFDALLESSVTKLPALVLIEADPADIHADYVVNDPDLSAPLLRGRYRPGKTDVKQVRAAFPERTLYLVHAASGQVIDLSP